MDRWPGTYEELRQAGKKLKAMGAPIGHTLGHAVTDGATHNYSLIVRGPRGERPRYPANEIDFAGMTG